MKQFSLKYRTQGISLIESVIGVALGIVCVTMMFKVISETMVNNKNIKEESAFSNPQEFTRQVRDEFEGAGFQLGINTPSNPRLFVCNLEDIGNKSLLCKAPAANDNSFCIISSKQRSVAGNNANNTETLITGFRRKPGNNSPLEKYKLIVPTNSPLATQPEKQLCEDSRNWNALHQDNTMKVNAFKVCLANITTTQDLDEVNVPPNRCNLGSTLGSNGNYKIISNTNHFIWFYIDTEFYGAQKLELPLKFLVYIRNKPDIVIP